MFDAILLMAGWGKRTGLDFNKTDYPLAGKPLYEYSLEQFLSLDACSHVILVVRADAYATCKSLENQRVKVVVGGKTRSASVLKGIAAADADLVLIHDAARWNVKKEDIKAVYNELLRYPSVCLTRSVSDTVRTAAGEILNRDALFFIATPEGLSRKLLLEGLKKEANPDFFDDCEVLQKYFGIKPKIVKGRDDNFKITTKDDLNYARYLTDTKKDIRIGHAKDTHRLVAGRKLILGGVEIPYHLGLLGNSDADVVYHAVAEAIIGALGKGDLGTFFPDTGDEFKAKESSFFVLKAKALLASSGYRIGNIDITVYLEEPYLGKYKALMCQNIAELLAVDVSRVNVKATRGEGLGFIGRKEGISAEAVCLIQK